MNESSITAVHWIQDTQHRLTAEVVGNGLERFRWWFVRLGGLKSLFKFRRAMKALKLASVSCRVGLNQLICLCVIYHAVDAPCTGQQFSLAFQLCVVFDSLSCWACLLCITTTAQILAAASAVFPSLYSIVVVDDDVAPAVAAAAAAK